MTNSSVRRKECFVTTEMSNMFALRAPAQTKRYYLSNFKTIALTGLGFSSVPSSKVDDQAMFSKSVWLRFSSFCGDFLNSFWTVTSNKRLEEAD